MSFLAIKQTRKKQRTKTKENLHSPRGDQNSIVPEETKTPLDQPGEKKKTSIARRARRKKHQGGGRLKPPSSFTEKTKASLS
jgi:hypothetical protein